MTKLIIFDLDGTLLDTLEDLAISTNHALAQNGYPQHEIEAYRFFVGNGITKLIERTLPQGARDEATVMQVRRDFVAYYSQHNMDRTRPYPGITELIRELQQRNIALAVASNKYEAATVELTGHYFPQGTFAVVQGQREGIPPKPDPTIVRHILEQTGVSKEQTLYVGDSGVDMRTAVGSGLHPVAVTWGFRPRKELEENGARSVIDRPSQLLKIIG